MPVDGNKGEALMRIAARQSRRYSFVIGGVIHNRISLKVYNPSYAYRRTPFKKTDGKPPGKDLNLRATKPGSGESICNLRTTSPFDEMT